MTISSRHNNIQKLATTIRNLIASKVRRWSGMDKVTLMGRLMLYEGLTHFLWIMYVVFSFTKFQAFIVPHYLLALLFGCGAFVSIVLILTSQIEAVKAHKKYFLRHQTLMLSVYVVYLSSFIVLIGDNSFIAGLSLSTAIVGLLLIDRKLVWRIFLIQCVMLIGYTILPYWFGHLPSLRQEALADVALAQKGYLFWHLSDLYFGLTKAVALVYTVRKLLDETEQHKNLARRNAEYDELTKVRNRRGLFDSARKGLYQQLSVHPTSMILIDLDHFKQINDVYGHLAGDEALYQIAQLFAKYLPDSAELGRYGGEEFLVLLPNTSNATAVQVAQSLRVQLANTPIDLGCGHKIAITASFGVASLHLECVECVYHLHDKVGNNRQYRRQFNLELTDIIKVVIDQADQALYQAKYQGRNRVVVAPVVSFDKLKPIGNFDATVAKASSHQQQ